MNQLSTLLIWIDDQTFPERPFVYLLRALAGNQEEGGEVYMATPEEIVEDVEQLGYQVSGDPSRWVRTHADNLFEFLTERDDEFNSVFNGFRPIVKKIESRGGRGSRSKYGLAFEQIRIHRSEGDIQYTSVEPRPLPRHLSFLLDSRFHEFNALLLGFLTMSTMIIFFWLISLFLPPLKDAWLIGLIGVGSVLGGVGAYQVFQQFDDLKLFRITVASGLFSLDNVLIERSDDSMDRLIKYVSECPVCGGRVEVVQLDDSGQLIGLCMSHPTSHRFSFDTYTKTGYAIDFAADYLAQSRGRQHE